MAARDYWIQGNGSMRPGYMSHAELKRELATAQGGRRDELVKEAQSRMKVATYPPFPAHLGLRPEG